MRVDFERERQWWNAKAPLEEQDRADEAVNRALRWREIERHLEGVETVLDVGGGTGAFSIPLARRGFQVTHLDFSTAMLERARQNALGLTDISFLEGNAVDLSAFPVRSFDLVLNLDGAISFCGAQAEQALRESCRVTAGTLIVTVSHRARMVPVWATSSLAALGAFAPAVRAMLEQGEWHQGQFPENNMLTRGCTEDYLGTMRAFLPHELRGLLEQAGMAVERCGGLGSLAGLCTTEAVDKVLTDEGLFEAFLDLCETFDREILPDGPGTRQRAGLIAVARRREAP